jgi:vacuolar-type H+-ATPase subunit F/Vma7
MASVWYIGDEATALAYRLAGVETRVPGAGETPAVYARAVEDGADLVLLASRNAAELGTELLGAALTSLRPLVELVPDWQGRDEPAEVARDIRLALGIEP